MSKIYIGSAKRGAAGVEAFMSGINVMVTSLVFTGSSGCVDGGTSYNM